MIQRSLLVTALTLLSAAAAVSPASADGPCCCPAPCAVAPRPVAVYEPFEMPRIYIVDQGPVYSGPGIYTNPTVVMPWRMARYPYVGRAYAYRPPYVAPLRVRY